MSTKHPSWQVLAGFTAGQLASEEHQTVEEHIAACETCAEQLDREPASDPLVGELRQLGGGFAADDPPLRMWIDGLKRFAPGRERSDASVKPGVEVKPEANKSSVSFGLQPASTPSAGSSQKQEKLPEQFGRYRIRKQLGRGGMGAVYLAHDSKLDRQVALKIPRFTPDDAPQYLERFTREARAAAALDHPNICPIYDVGEVDGIHYISMAYIEGKTLAELIPDPAPATPLTADGARGEKDPSPRGQDGSESVAPSPRARGEQFIPQRQVAAVIRELALALEEAHVHGIIHRDLKPSNIMVNKRRRLVIMDFGLAGHVRLTDAGDTGGADQGKKGRLTSSGMIMGTPAYMSPEQATGDVSAMGPACDIYSLGVIMYELLTGEAPFKGPPAAVLGQIMVADPPRPSSLRSDLDAQLEAICLRAMAKKIADRHTSMTELAEALTGYLQPAKKQANATSTSSKQRGPSGNVVGDPALRQFFDQLEEGRESIPVPARKVIEAGPSSQTQGVPHRPRSRYLLPVAVAASVLFAVGAYFAPHVIRIVTNKGVVVIEAADKDVEVAIRGESLTIHDLTTKQAYHLKIGRQNIPAGDYWLEVTSDAGLDVDSREFKITRNGKQVVKVSLEKQLASREANAGTNNVGSSAPGAPGVNSQPSTGWHGWPADAPPPAIAPFDADTAERHQEAWAKYLKMDVEFTNSLGMKFRLIPPGEFTMGSTPAEIEEALKVAKGDGYWPKHWQECIKSEAPQHKVILTQPIYLGVHEVTQADYEKVMGKNPAYFATTGSEKALVEKVAGMDTSSQPVEGVSWNDAAEFCAKLSQQEKLKPFYFRAGETVTSLDGTGYRLPSEAEWEFACRAGTTTKYWIGDKYEELMRAGWFAANSGGRTHAVGELKGNPFGLYDIHGNVREWVQDVWQPTYYGQFRDLLAINPNSPFSAGSARVFRGGGWRNFASHCRPSSRDAGDAPGRHPDIGFRVSLVCDVSRVAGKDTATSTTSEAGLPVGAAAEDKGFVPLFNGKDLTGWVLDGWEEDAWRVENEELVADAAGELDGKRRVYLLTEREYADFRLRFQFQRSSDTAISAVALRAVPHETARDSDPGILVEDDYPYHLSVQIRKWQGVEGTGNLWWSPTGAQPPLIADQLAEVKPPGEWNDMEVEMQGQSLRVAVNGRVVQNIMLNKTRPLLHPALGLSRYSGRIGFARGNGEVRFRNIEIKELPAGISTNKARASQRFKVGNLGGVWEVDNEELVMVEWKEQPNNSWIYFGDASWTDYDFTVEAKRTALNDGFGLEFRATQEWWNNCLFAVGGNPGNSNHHLSCPAGEGHVLASKPGSIKTGQWYTALVRVRDKQVQCFLNGVKLFDEQTESQPAGFVTLRTWQSPYRFRNIKVTDPEGNVLLEGLPDLDPAPETGQAAPAATAPDRRAVPTTPPQAPAATKWFPCRIPYPDRSDWRIEGDELVQYFRAGDVRIIFGDPNWTDYDFSVETKWDHTLEPAAIYFRYEDDKNFYDHRLSGRGNRVEDIEDMAEQGRRAILSERNFSAQTGRWYHTEIRHKGLSSKHDMYYWMTIGES